MTNIIKKLEDKQIEKLMENKTLPNFKPGDTLRVHLKIKEGNRERVQLFEGVCIAREGSGINASFTVRKETSGVGVERKFPLYTKSIEKLEKIRIGRVRRAKLFFLRALTGKKARIVEDLSATANEKKGKI